MVTKVGADPEVFFVDKTNGNIVPANCFLVGTKKAPAPVERGSVQVDGVAGEFNIDPARSAEEFKTNIEFVFNEMCGMASVVNEDIIPSDKSIYKFSDEVWNCLPDNVKILGCDPDYNVYTKSIVLRENDKYRDMKVRSAGGHVHIGFTLFDVIDVTNVKHLEHCARIVEYLDENLYPILSEAAGEDGKEREQLLYGQKGMFRPKPYGVEYRTPSNCWIFDDKLMTHVFDMSVQSIKEV